MAAQRGIPQNSHRLPRPVDATAWMDQAACKGQPDWLMFPAKAERADPAILRICGGCEVRKPCLDYAIEHDENHGVWGGLTENQRRDLKRRATT